SSCDLPAELATELGIDIVPLTIRFGNEEFVDRLDLSPKEFWARCSSSPVLPETAAPPPGAFEDVFRSAAGAGAGGIVCINLSSKLSATIQSAQIAAKSRQRTRSRALSYLIDKVRDLASIERLAVMHGDAPDIDEFLDRLATLHPRDDIMVGDIGAVIGTHSGPRAIGVVFQTPR